MSFSPFLAPSLMKLTLILMKKKTILKQETLEKLITKLFEGRYQELPVFTENLCGNTFMIYPHEEETPVQSTRDCNKMKT